jgi:tetratricopeptide (TPR) repeat protein
MRNVFAVCAIAFAITSGASHAAEPKPVPAETQPAVAATQSQLDKLFAELKRERNPQAADRISRRIWDEWYKSGSASIDLMMEWSNDAVQAQKFDVALDFLDQVVTLQPEFAEGWNRRATVHFLMRQFGKSMADIERALELEPRHFGALSGMAQIMKETGRRELALRAWQRVIDIYPMMRSAQDEIATLSEELAGESI